MDHHDDGDEQQTAEHKHQRKPLESPKVAGAGRAHDDQRSVGDSPELVDTEVVQAEADADEFGHDGQGVEREQVDHAERAPKLAEPLEDESGMADAGDGAQAQHHLLVDVEHRDEQEQRPHERGAVVLSGLRVGAEGARVVVAHHDDEARAQDGQERTKAMRERLSCGGVAVGDAAKRADDVADVSAVKNRRRGWRRRNGGGGDVGHDGSFRTYRLGPHIAVRSPR